MRLIRVNEGTLMNDEAATTGFRNGWRELLTELPHEWERLHREIAQLRRERDQLAKALVAALREEVTLTQEEILAQVGREQPLRELLEDMRAQLAGD